MRKQSKYPFSALEVGQEHFIPLEENDTIQKLRSRVSANATMYSRNKETKFGTRTAKEGIYLVRML